MLARAGAPVVLIGRAGLVEAVRQNGLLLDTLMFQERVNVEASTEISAARGAELVLFSVKTLDSETAARQLAAHLGPHASVVSLQNGVDNAERIRATAGVDALPAAVYVAAAKAGAGTVKHSGRGDLVIGPRSERSEYVAKIFERASVPCRISDNIIGELWTKLVWNCAGNAISALARVNYGQIGASAEARPMVEAVVYETLAVARASGVRMKMLEDPQNAITDGLIQIAKQMGRATSSTAQDLARGKRTEIDALNGYVARLGAKLGVATPVNYALFALVKLAEINLAEANPAVGETGQAAR
jgi:2-dehydropantoate 2-reductase